MGAVRPSTRRPAVKVVVFQCPCGTAARQRWPRFERPRRRAILVEAPVSSMNTKQQGSRLGCCTSQASRRAATSGRSCSAACAVFFEAEPSALEEPPHGGDGDRDTALPQQGLQLGQRHIRPPFHLAQKKASLRLDPPRATVPALRSGADLAPVPPSTNPTDRAGNTHAKTRRCLSSGYPRLNRGDNTHPKIVGKALHHACWPPLPAQRVNHKSAQKGIPCRLNPLENRSSVCG